MKIVADENIPQIEQYFGSGNELILKSGRLISRSDVVDADVLLVRSVTKVNESLLQNTAVKFVGSTTAGMDHIDTQWLESAGIQWRVAAGCNAVAVAEYVVCVVAALQQQGLLRASKPRAAVIGVGQVGRRVVTCLKQLGFDVLQCDPMRADSDPAFVHTAMDELQDLDFISVHTPLTLDGQYSTYHLINKAFMQRQRSGCVMLNAGRGEVVSFEDVKQYGRHLHWCLDVWENEPDIDLDVLAMSMIATPHIAGYTVEAKLRGVEMIYQAMCALPDFAMMSRKGGDVVERDLAFILDSMLQESGEHWREVVLKMYNPQQTSEYMKNALMTGLRTFDFLRKNFPERHEFNMAG